MKNYISVAYDKKEKPVTSYPDELARYLMRRFKMKKGMKILDNGCGRGDYLNAFRNCGMSVTGTDIDPYCEDIAGMDFNKDYLPFKDNSFDIVFSKSVLEHLDNNELYLSEVYRVLKKGGRIILLVPEWETQYKIFYQDPTHIHPYSVKSIDRLLNMMGFRMVQTERFVQLPSVWRYKGWRWVSKLIRCIVGPVKRVYKNKLIRFSSELMVLGTGVK